MSTHLLSDLRYNVLLFLIFPSSGQSVVLSHCDSLYPLFSSLSKVLRPSASPCYFSKTSSSLHSSGFETPPLHSSTKSGPNPHPTGPRGYTPDRPLLLRPSPALPDLISLKENPSSSSISIYFVSKKTFPNNG